MFDLDDNDDSGRARHGGKTEEPWPFDGDQRAPSDVLVPEEIHTVTGEPEGGRAASAPDGNYSHESPLPLDEDEMAGYATGSVLQEKKKGSSMIPIIGGVFFLFLVFGVGGILVLKPKGPSSEQIPQMEEIGEGYIEPLASPVATLPSNDENRSLQDGQVEAVEPDFDTAAEKISAPVIEAANSTVAPQLPVSPSPVATQTAPPSGLSPVSIGAAPLSPVSGAGSGPKDQDIAAINVRIDELAKRLDDIAAQLEKLASASVQSRGVSAAAKSNRATAPSRSVSAASVTTKNLKTAGNVDGQKPRYISTEALAAQKAVHARATVTPSPSKDVVAVDSVASAPAAAAPSVAVSRDVTSGLVVSTPEQKVVYALTGVIGSRAWISRRSADGHETEVSVTTGDRVDGVVVKEVNDKERKVVLQNGVVIASGSQRR